MSPDICLLCESSGPDGIKLFSARICVKCEQKITALEVGAPEYTKIVDKLKRAWRSEMPVSS